MNRKTKNFITIIILTIGLFTSQLTKPNSQDDFNFDNFNSIDFDDIYIPADFFDDIDYSQIPTRSYANIFEELADIILDINTPLWGITKPPKGRDVLYLMPHRISALEYGGLMLNLFFNSTKAMNFSTNETLKFDENKLALDQLLSVLITELGVKEASSLIPLFKKLTIQERKLGALMQLAFTKSMFKFEINTSLQFSERNFWLNKDDQARIQEMFSDSDSTFDNKELCKTKLGFGDTRVKLGLNTLNMSNLQVDVGFEGIIPTSKISTDPKLQEYHRVDLNNFINDIPDLLRNIRDNLITPQLGNYGHFGLGCFFESKIDLLNNNLHFFNRISFDNLFTAKEYRLIPSKQTIFQPISLEELKENPEYETKFIKEYVFPPAYKVLIQPGDIINFVSSITYNTNNNWNLGFGYDYYNQQREKFEKIYTTEDASSLKIKSAIAPAAIQHKLFFNADHIKKYKKWDFVFGLGGDYTISAKNIGRDWTLFLKIGASF